MIIIDGKATAAVMREELREEVKPLAERFGRKPGLVVILVGEDPASQVYVRNKGIACEKAGFYSETVRLPATTKQQELEDFIDTLNKRNDVDGILLQLPLPKGLDSQRCLEKIDPGKDVDGFHPANMGRLVLGLPCYKPCTPFGVMVMLKRYGIDPAGKKAVVLGRSNIVGKPLALMLTAANATVTLCHSRTPDLKKECHEADIICAALGKPNFVTGDMVKKGAVIIDVGINRTDSGLVGDCDYDSVKEKASAITPVPGGVGPMTIAMLLENTMIAFGRHNGITINRNS